MGKARQAAYNRFTKLVDGPASLTAGRTVAVNGSGTALEMIIPVVPSFLDLPDTPNSFSGKGEKGLRVNAGGTALEFGQQQDDFFRLGPGQENPDGSSLLITSGATAWKDIFRSTLPFQLYYGDRVFGFAEMEIRNDASYTVEIATTMIISNVSSIPSGTDIDGTGIYLGIGNGHNVEPVPNGDHYYNVPKIGATTMQANYTTPSIFLRARAKSSDATGSDYCTLMAGYGQIVLYVQRKNAA